MSSCLCLCVFVFVSLCLCAFVYVCLVLLVTACCVVLQLKSGSVCERTTLVSLLCFFSEWIGFCRVVWCCFDKTFCYLSSLLPSKSYPNLNPNLDSVSTLTVIQAPYSNRNRGIIVSCSRLCLVLSLPCLRLSSFISVSVSNVVILCAILPS